MGGSLPIAPIGEVLGTPFVIVPIVNADNNQHAPNENLRMAEFRRGIALYAALLAERRPQLVIQGEHTVSAPRASAARAFPIQSRKLAINGSSSRSSCHARKYAPPVIVCWKGRRAARSRHGLAQSGA